MKDRRWTALVVFCTGMLMIILDVTIVNVALPAVQRELGFGQSGLAWVVNAYLIPFGSLLFRGVGRGSGLYVQHVLGYDALRIGLAFLPVTVVMGGLSLHGTGRLIGRFGTRLLVITGFALVAAGLTWFARVPVDGAYLTVVLPSMLLLGVGAGLAFPALAALAMSSCSPDDAGLASGVFNTTAQVGSALGLAVLATLSAGRQASLRSAGAGDLVAQTGGYRLAFLVAAALVVVALVVVVAVVRPVRRTPASAPSSAAREPVTV